MRSKGFIVFLVLVSLLVFGALYYLKTTPPSERVLLNNVSDKIAEVIGNDDGEENTNSIDIRDSLGEIFGVFSHLGDEVSRVKENIISTDGIEVWEKIVTKTSLCTTREEIVDKICEEFNSYSTRVDIVVTDEAGNGDYLNDILTEVFKANPQWFWLTGGGNWSLVSVGSIVHASFTADTICDPALIPDYAAMLEQRLAEITYGASLYGTDFEKILFVHDSIVLGCRYDEDVYHSVFLQGMDEDSFSFTAFGALVNGTAVCDGYSKAFKLIMDRLMIECGIVTGYAFSQETSGPHSWNYCLIDGAYYFIDVTWDDPIGELPDDYISHEYFCITTDMLLADHEIDGGQFVPDCYDMTYVGIVA